MCSYQFCLTVPGAPASWFSAVVDVYQGWCGPCKPVVSLFQKMRVEVGPDLLHFASVRSSLSRMSNNGCKKLKHWKTGTGSLRGLWQIMERVSAVEFLLMPVSQGRRFPAFPASRSPAGLGPPGLEQGLLGCSEASDPPCLPDTVKPGVPLPEHRVYDLYPCSLKGAFSKFPRVSGWRWESLPETRVADARWAARGEAQPVNKGATRPRDNSGEAGLPFPGPALLLGSFVRSAGEA